MNGGAVTMEDKFTKRIITIFFTCIIALMLFVCGIFLYQSHQKNTQHSAFTITLEKDSINFHGATNDIIPYKDIQSIQYHEQKLPSGKKQGAGEATSHYIVGDATFDEIGTCRAYLYTDEFYYVTLITSDAVYLFNAGNQKDTLEIYDEVLQAIGQEASGLSIND